MAGADDDNASSSNGMHHDGSSTSQAFTSARRRPHSGRQFLAVLRKNALLQTRSGRSFLGISGWAALALEILTPAAFFLLMCLPKYYFNVKPTPIPMQLFQATDLADPHWANKYEGPAARHGFRAKILYAPTGSSTDEFIGDLARELACPAEPSQKGASSGSFYSLFRPLVPAPECAEQAACLQQPACWQHIVEGDDASLTGYSSEEEAADWASEHPLSVDAILTFDNTGTDQPQYTIRGNHTDLPSTRLLYNEFDLLPDPQYKLYWLFANLQQSLDRTILGRAMGSGHAPAPVDVSVKPFPWPSVRFDVGAIAAAAAFNLLLVFAFLTPTRGAVATIVREKELRLREGMRILGLKDGAYWGAWALTHWASLAVSGLLCAIIARYPFPHTDFGLMLLLLWLTAAALLAFAYFLSALFAKARVAGMASAMLYAVAMVPGYIMSTFQPYGGLGWPLACLLPPSAISLFATVLLKLEGSQRGVTWSTMNLQITSQFPFSAATVFQMLALDVVLYSVLAWYLDAVVPSGYGQRRPWYFPVLPSYWRGHAGGGSSRKSDTGASSEERLLAQETSGSAAVAIRHLCKDFRTTDGYTQRAVDDLSLDVASSKVTALLGHNGAGKTTAISILTGMLPPTSGDALMMGRSILTDMPGIRQDLGCCPQFDILWPEITVLEHLRIYAAIKGFRGRDTEDAALAAAAEVGLQEKGNTRAEELSGGQRRKLSVAIAFLGSPSVVFLDEPTSGMDPYSRRFTWDVIRNNRAGRVIVLTTHSMEEADLLADRIAIMARGRVVAEGTSADLKSRYGVGYTLTMAKQRQDLSSSGHSSEASLAHVASSRSLSELSEGDASVSSLIRRHVPHAALISRGPAELAFRLPKEDCSKLPSLLQELEDSKAELGISSFGLSVTTLEEVFLAVSAAASEEAKARKQGAAKLEAHSAPPAGAAEANDQKHDGEAVDEKANVAACVGEQQSAVKPYSLVRGPRLYLQQWYSLFLKRMLSAKRDRLALVTQLLVPIALVLVALWARQATDAFPQEPVLDISREGCLRGQTAPYGAAAGARANASALHAFQDAYPQDKLQDTGAERLWQGPFFAPTEGTLDGWLLDKWYTSATSYDGLFWHNTSSSDQVLSQDGRASYTILFNTTATHGLPAAINQASSALLRAITGNPGAGISVRNHPMPTLQQEAAVQFSKEAGDLLLVLCLTMATSVLSASFAVFLVRERECHSKGVQVVAGASPSAFWSAAYAWDLLNFSLPTLGIIVCFYCFDLPQFRGERMGATACLLWLFGAAGIACTYLFSFAFLDEMVALQRINSYSFLLGYLGFLASWILDTIYSLLHRSAVKTANDGIKSVLMVLSPHYNLARGIYEVSQTYGEEGGEANTSPWVWTAAGQYFFWLGLQAIGYMALTLLVEYGLLGSLHVRLRQGLQRCMGARRHKQRRQQGYAPIDEEAHWQEGERAEDEDVEAERSALQTGGEAKDLQVLIRGLEKSYNMGPWEQPNRALRGLWLGVQHGECFGLLGMNGAGKTTAFRLLSGELRPDEGDAFVAGHSVISQLSAARQQLGYCPQFNALPGALTGREVLHMYARLRGVPSPEVRSAVEDLIERIDLSEYADRVCESYSGGNKRKLCVAVALVGSPGVVLMDEPSTGMDPGAKRFLWDLIRKQVIDKGHTVIMTSHSMEECEVLCSRIGILAAGQLRCLGSVQHLKDRFGAGYILNVRFRHHGQAEESQVLRWVEEHVPGADLQQKSPRNISFSIAQQDLHLPAVFKSMESSKEELDVVEYSLTQTTLENVFVALAQPEASAQSQEQQSEQ